MGWLGLLAVLIILGALAGGNSLGETIRKGLGCLLVIIIVVFVLAAIGANGPGYA